MTTTWSTVSGAVVQSVADAAATSATAAAADVVLTNADVVLTNADVVSTNADVVLTTADVVSTNADVVSTNADVALTAADVVSTNADVVLTTADVATTAANVALTAADVVSTAADLVQTDLDVTATAASASGAATSATNAATSATAAATSATAGATSATNASTSATAAAGSATNASTSATAAAASLSEFNGIYYGSSSTDPTTSIAVGDIYFNNSSSQLLVYNGSTWQAGVTNTSGLQPADAGLTSISNLTTAADKMIYTSAADTYLVTALTAAGRAILDDADAAAQRTTLGLGTGDSPTFTAVTATGLASLADITLTAANPEILGGDTDGVTYLSGGASTALGSSIRLHGDTHATLADDFMVYGSATLQGHYDDSASTWDFQANAITTTGAITAAQYDSTESLPDIKPSLNLDFANVKKLDPRITFTRGSTATYYDGKTFAKAEENLLLYSQDYSTTWTVTNLTPVTGKTAPDGTSTATEFTAGAGNAVLTQGYTALADDYTFSVWLRRVTGTGNIDIAADNGTWNTETISGTWARYDVTQTPAAGSTTAGIRVVTSGDAIEVWGAQLEQRDALTDYTATTDQPITNYIPALQTAASGEARFDHDPTTFESLGLLIEESRTNLVVRSQELDNASWTKTRSSVTANTIVAPDGTLTGDKLVEDSTVTNTHFVWQAASVTSGVAVTFSVYAKAAENGRVSLCFANTGAFSAAQRATFNLSTGAVVVDQGTPTTAVAILSDGWYRCSMTASPTSTASATCQIYLDDGTGVVISGDGYSGIYLWGAQLEAGAFPTSYIPTVASQVTRSADAASMTGTNFSSWYRQDEGTVYVNYSAPNLGSLIISDPYLVGFSGGALSSSAPRISLRLEDADNSVNLQVTDASGSGVSANITGGIPANLTDSRVSAAYAVNDFAISVFDNAVVTDTSGYVAAGGITHLHLGHDTGSLNGHIKKFAYYPKRLSNATLQALTEE